MAFRLFLKLKIERLIIKGNIYHVILFINLFLKKEEAVTTATMMTA